MASFLPLISPIDLGKKRGGAQQQENQQAHCFHGGGFEW